VTTYDNATAGSGSAVNQVQPTYDGWGNLTTFTADPDGVIGAGGVPAKAVSYTYAAATSGRNTIRRTGVTLPGSTTVSYIYGTGTTHEYADEAILLGAWGTNTPKADLNLDGTVDGADNTIVLAEAGATAGWETLGRNRNRFGYAGYAADMAVNANWHVQHRNLAAGLGVWLQRDPIEYLAGPALASYVRAVALGETDPSGLRPIGGRVDLGGCGSRHLL